MIDSIAVDKSGVLSALQIVTHFGEAFADHDVDAMMRLMAEDRIFENTYPAPDGTRYESKAAVRAFWEEFFRTSCQPRFETEVLLAFGDRCIVRWTYHWLNADGSPGHVRGVNIFRLKDGFISEKLSYVKR